jgi:hypothetical protein
LWAHNSVNTPWVDNVSNSDGWIVEFKIKTSDSSSGFYQRARIYDGKYGLEFRFYPSANPYMTVIIGNSVHSFTSVNEDYDIVFGALGPNDSDIGRIHSFRIEGENANLRIYVDNILISSLSGSILSTSTLQKFVDFGDNSGIKSESQTTDWGIIRYLLSTSSTTVFDTYNSDKYLYWTYIKEEDVTASSTSYTRNNKDLAGWYVITQNETPNVKLYNSKIEKAHSFYTMYDKDKFNVAKIKFYDDITDNIDLVNDAIGFNYIEGDANSDKILLVGRDVENNYATVKMIRYGHHFDEILYNASYGYPGYGSDVYLTNYGFDALGREAIQAKIFIVSRGAETIQASLYVYNDAVDIKLYKDYALSYPLDKYNGVPVADFSTITQKVYIKITYYSPKNTLPTVVIDQQGSLDETLNTERIDEFTFRAEYQINVQDPNKYLDGFANITIQD